MKEILPMRTPADDISEFVYENCVWPALERGDNVITIDTSAVCDALQRAYSQNVISAALRSRHFRDIYRVMLESAEIGATETYTFRLDVGRAMLTKSLTAQQNACSYLSVRSK